MATFISNSPAETEALGREFATALHEGDIVALEGDLGAGKTSFTKGVVAGTGSPAAVSSPTFTLVHEYSGASHPIFHFDFYRLNEAAEARALALDDYFYADGISIVEWADRFRELIPANAKWVRIVSTGPDQRSIHLP